MLEQVLKLGRGTHFIIKYMGDMCDVLLPYGDFSFLKDVGCTDSYSPSHQSKIDAAQSALDSVGERGSTSL